MLFSHGCLRGCVQLCGGILFVMFGVHALMYGTA